MHRYIARTLLFIASMIPLTLRAGIIIDDFDDPAEVISPEMELIPVVTTNVGDFEAQRKIYIFGNQTDPIATLDANVTSASVLTGKFARFQLNDPVGGLMRFVTDYDFDRAYDFTESGNSNSLLLDFRSISGVTPPSVLFVVINGGASTTSVALPSFDSFFTIALPFDSFGSRGSIPPSSVFPNVISAHFAFFIDNLGGEQQGGVFQLDRIRVSRSVPEPNCPTMIAAAVWVLACARVIS